MTLAHPISAAAQIVTVDSGTLHPKDILTIDEETMQVVSLMNYRSAQVLRGVEGTAAVVHMVGTPVRIVGGLDWRAQRRQVRDEQAATGAETGNPFETWTKQQIANLSARLALLERGD